jgi:hypothetical protein
MFGDVSLRDLTQADSSAIILETNQKPFPVRGAMASAMSIGLAWGGVGDNDAIERAVIDITDDHHVEKLRYATFSLIILVICLCNSLDLPSTTGPTGTNL